MNVLFHPEMLVVDAARIAKAQGCTLRYEGNRFVARPIVSSPRSHRQSRRAFFWARVPK